MSETRLDDIGAYRCRLREGLWGFRVELRDGQRFLQYGLFTQV